MPLPISKGEMKRLGKRLRAHDVIADEDLALLAVAFVAYEEALAKVSDHLVSLGFSPTTRPKTTRAIVYKLRRSTIPLSQIQDLVGARIVVEDLQAQEQARQRICDFYSSVDTRWKPTDRLANPMHGYRAVHVVPYVSGIPVEIQVRTELQDAWAQMVEGLASSWGRGIKYEEGPEEPERTLWLGYDIVTRRQVVALFMRLSKAVAAVEEARDEQARRQSKIQDQLATVAELQDSPSEWLGRRVPDEMLPDVRRVFAGLWSMARRLHLRDRAMLVGGPKGITVGQLLHAVDLSVAELRRASRVRAIEVEDLEVRLRSILRSVATAAEHAGV